MRHYFRRLLIWKKSFQLVQQIYLETEQLPSVERFGLVSQIQRSAVSIPSNIAEGSGREGSKQFNYFLDIAISSSFELETQLLLAKGLYEMETDTIILELHEVQRMIRGFKRKISLE